MTPNKAAQFVMAAIGLVDGRPKSIKNLLGSVVEKLYQDIVFIFEIKIYGTIRHTGLPGDLGNGRLVKALAGKHFYSCFQDEMILVIFDYFIDFRPPVFVNQIPSK
jgi:hypothetical protein